MLVDSRYPMSLTYLAHIYASKGMYEHYQDVLKALLVFDILINHKAPIDDTVKSIYSSINEKKIKEDHPIQYEKYYKPVKLRF